MKQMEATLTGSLHKEVSKKHDRNYSIIVTKVAYNITFNRTKSVTFA